MQVLRFVTRFLFVCLDQASAASRDDNGRIEVGCALLQCLIRTKEYQREAMRLFFYSTFLFIGGLSALLIFYPSSIRF
ncbi:hypothetical protein SDJN03_00940, partial [Cucurbita argyrosperma subsp. sororia]